MPLRRQRGAVIIQAHDEIRAALAARDPQASAVRMREHLEVDARYARRKFPEVLDQVMVWDRPAG